MIDSNNVIFDSCITVFNFDNEVLYHYRHFVVKDKTDEKEAEKLFSVPDFIGDACKAIASRVRGAVAQVQFDDFHKVKK